MLKIKYFFLLATAMGAVVTGDKDTDTACQLMSTAIFCAQHNDNNSMIEAYCAKYRDFVQTLFVSENLAQNLHLSPEEGLDAIRLIHNLYKARHAAEVKAREEVNKNA
ncbi:MAG: hypothetical protein WC707_05060 [Candidatus Babeliaceae bacterium]|jgi:hypothetical protein